MSDDPRKFAELVNELRNLPNETETVEFKENNTDPEIIGKSVSALANAAALTGAEYAYLVWGISDANHDVVGTDFHYRQKRIGNEEVENWLTHNLKPSLDCSFEEGNVDNHHVVVLRIRAVAHMPIRFKETEYIRVGSYTKKLRDHPEKERRLWLLLKPEGFEEGIVQEKVKGADLKILLDYWGLLKLYGLSERFTPDAMIDQLEQRNFIVRRDLDSYDITNLCAILFARHLSEFDRLERKALRVIRYDGDNRVSTIHEQTGVKGYAVGFEGLISYLSSQLPRNDVLQQAFQREVGMYPDVALRELTANAIIHQDFSIDGAGPMIEVFDNRIEFTNPGHPLIETLRFIDSPPRSRNEKLALFMREVDICEERGSGIDKVIHAVELFQLPAPEFAVLPHSTRVTLFAPKSFAEMSRDDRVRACYQHACLQAVSGKQMTNTSLRERFSIDDRNYPMASRIIADTITAGLIKQSEPQNKSKRHMRYVPFWA